MKNTITFEGKKYSIPATLRTPVNNWGKAENAITIKTGILRSNRWTPNRVIRVFYAAPPAAMPADGGSYPGGKFVDATPTGKVVAFWD